MTEQALNEIDSRNKENKQTSRRIMENHLHELDEAFLRLGLTDEQEQDLINIANQNIANSLALYEEGLGVDEHLFAVVVLFRKQFPSNLLY